MGKINSEFGPSPPSKNLPFLLPPPPHTFKWNSPNLLCLIFRKHGPPSAPSRLSLLKSVPNYWEFTVFRRWSSGLEINWSQEQGVTQDLETGGQNWGFFKFRGSKVSYPIYKNDHSNLIYWLSKTKCASLCHLMYLLSSRSETFEIFPWTQTNTENLAKYNWVSFSPKNCVWESKWLPGGCLGKSLARSPGLPWILLTVTIAFSCDSLKSSQGPQRCTGFYIQHLEGAFECTRLSYQSMGKIIISSNVQIHNVIKVTHGTKCYPWTSKSAKLDRQQFTYKLLNATWNIPPEVLSTVSRLAGSQFRSC